MFKQLTLVSLDDKRVGIHSYDWRSYILFRKSSDIVRRYNAWGITKTLLEDIIKKGCKILIIKVDGIAKFKINPKVWLDNAIIGKLTSKQELHAFLPINKFRKVKVLK